ncbi:DNA translocase FtsK 4TM domain-containing protein [Desulfococcaceae bacterium HSG8]|nr:DNA translocase FtsK 4TM domain-containing protein [Desulfococcaceae bacterium HSG8]
MRKEFPGIILFFLFIFTLISLLSYSPSDPSIHYARHADNVHNLFGLPGAYVSGILIGLCGVGAICIPGVFLFSSLRFFTDHQEWLVVKSLIGGILLAVTTGSIFALARPDYLIFGNRISSGGLIGIPINSFLTAHSGSAGAVIVLALIWGIGFVLAAGLHVNCVTDFRKRPGQFVTRVFYRAKTLMIIRKEQRKRAKKRSGQ